MRERKSTHVRLREGWGVGRGADYRPWVRVRDVPSRALSWRVDGVVSGRVHHFLSTLELLWFLIFDWRDDVEDIREQYRLDRDETVAIARALRVRHPGYTRPKDEHHMSTDLVVTIRQPVGRREVAIACKPAPHLDDLRVREKLSIEREYWRARGIDWWIATDAALPGEYVANLRWLRAARDERLLELDAAERAAVAERVAQCLTGRDGWARSLALVCRGVDVTGGHAPGTALAVLRHMLASKRWHCDLGTRIDPNRPFARLLRTPEVA